jgi:hypothetical protein
MLIQKQTKWRATGRSKKNFGQRFSWAPLAFSELPQLSQLPIITFAHDSYQGIASAMPESP